MIVDKSKWAKAAGGYLDVDQTIKGKIQITFNHNYRKVYLEPVKPQAFFLVMKVWVMMMDETTQIVSHTFAPTLCKECFAKNK